MTKPKPPQRVTRCTTHHAACDCREWQNERMRTALAIIRTWAACDHLSHESRGKAMFDIENKCREALEPISHD